MSYLTIEHCLPAHGIFFHLYSAVHESAVLMHTAKDMVATANLSIFNTWHAL